jgi:hypothetical protein
MPDAHGWPDRASPGIPANPTRDGPHLIEKGPYRVWVWWLHIGQTFLLPARGDPAWGVSRVLHPLIAAQEWTYLGPAIAPDGRPVP